MCQLWEHSTIGFRSGGRYEDTTTTTAGTPIGTGNGRMLQMRRASYLAFYTEPFSRVYARPGAARSCAELGHTLLSYHRHHRIPHHLFNLLTSLAYVLPRSALSEYISCHINGGARETVSTFGSRYTSPMSTLSRHPFTFYLIPITWQSWREGRGEEEKRRRQNSKRTLVWSS